jgi:Flp pilus assembly protein TadG
MKTSIRISAQRRVRKVFQHGVAAVEFALVAAVFFMTLIGLMEMGRVLFYWNSAAEATRLGARLAVVCDLNDVDIKARMRQMLAIAPATSITIDYQPGGCTVNTCQYVTVSLSSIPVTTFIPFVPLSLSIPPFSTSLPRESMRSTVDGQPNPVCS